MPSSRLRPLNPISVSHWRGALPSLRSTFSANRHAHVYTPSSIWSDEYISTSAPSALARAPFLREVQVALSQGKRYDDLRALSAIHPRIFRTTDERASCPFGAKISNSVL